MLDDSLLLDHRALALVPVFSGEYLSKIYTTHGIYYSKICPVELLNAACLRYHFTKKGRKEVAKKLLNFKYKPPFLISEEFGVFPITSTDNPKCMWIFSHFFHTKKINKNCTELTFHDGTQVLAPVSTYVIKEQKLKLHMLLSHMQQAKRTNHDSQAMLIMESYQKYLLNI